MPAPVDTPYIIGVIRHQERTLLGDDEYTRLIGAPDAARAEIVLRETPYGQWISQAETGGGTAIEQGLEKRLLHVLEWLRGVCDEPQLLTFIQTRYDALNVAAALLDYHAGRPEPGQLSPFGSVAAETLQSAIWHDAGWELLPDAWAARVRRERERTMLAGERDQLVAAVEETAFEILEAAAMTDWMRSLVSLWRDRAFVDRLLRTGVSRGAAQAPLQRLTAENSAEEIAQALQEAGYRGFTPALLGAVREQTADWQYERQWDEQIVQRVRSRRSIPVGFDPIVAWWLTLELEVRTIRLLLAARREQRPAQELQSLIRMTYRTFV